MKNSYIIAALSCLLTITQSMAMEPVNENQISQEIKSANNVECCICLKPGASVGWLETQRPLAHTDCYNLVQEYSGNIIDEFKYFDEPIKIKLIQQTLKFVDDTANVKNCTIKEYCEKNSTLIMQLLFTGGVNNALDELLK